VDVGGLIRDLYVAHHGTALLREASDVEHRHTLVLEMSGHTQQRADCHDARATHTGHEHTIRPLDRRQLRRRHWRHGIGRRA
jgi:hypothetical protein